MNAPPDRPRRRLTLWHALAAAAGWLLAACGSGTAWRPGTSEQPHVLTERQRTPSQASADPWAPMASVSSFPTADDRRLPSSGHNPPYWSGEVRVNPALWATYPRLEPEKPAPEGAIALEFHHDLAGNAQQIYAMEKRAAGFDPGGGDWEYLVINPQGLVETRGILPFCARCHVAAPHPAEQLHRGAPHGGRPGPRPRPGGRRRPDRGQQGPRRVPQEAAEVSP
jgi:hypothetical protein